MTENENLITELYSALQAKDGKRMGACYGPEASFNDPVFGPLKGPQIEAMWTMLAGRSKDIRVVFDSVQADAQSGKAHWEAWYTFSATGRKVHNIIEASFVFRDGKILEHHDRFSLWRWSSQALGVSGLLLGWSPLVQNRIRKTARDGLKVFQGRK